MTETAIIGRDHRNVGFTEAFKLGFSNYVLFQGRSSRGAFWFWVLALWIVGVVLSFVDYLIFGSAQMNILSGIWSLATIIPSYALGARRLHDVNRSGWWQLLVLSVIAVIVLLYWYCQPGEARTNDFGPDVEAGKA